MFRRVVLTVLVAACVGAAMSGLALLFNLSAIRGAAIGGAPAEALPGPTTPTVRLTLSAPPLIAPGAEAAGSDDAAALVEARFDPARPGRAVDIEARSRPGGTWQVVARGLEDGNGWVRIDVPAADSWSQFRAVAPGVGSIAEVRSRPRTSPWAPQVSDEFDALAADWTSRQAAVADGVLTISPRGEVGAVAPALEGDGFVAARVRFAERGVSSLVVTDERGQRLLITHVGNEVDALVAQRGLPGTSVRDLSNPGDSQPLRPDYAAWSSSFHVVSFQRSGTSVVFAVDGQPFAHSRAQAVGTWTMSIRSGQGPTEVDWVKSWSAQP